MTVYVVQNSMRMNSNGALVPKFDLEPARKFGEVRTLLSPSAGPWRIESILRDLRRELAEFSDADYLLLTGNPILIGLATAEAARRNKGRVRFLQWSGRDESYVSVDGQGIGLGHQADSGYPRV